MYTAKILIIAFSLIMICVGLAVWANTSVINLSQKAKVNKITTFRDCALAGYPLQESFPRKCQLPGGKSFAEQLDTPEPSFADFAPNGTPVPPEIINSNNSGSLCTNSCGDNVCQMIVCEGSGCPCSESANSCPQDCH